MNQQPNNDPVVIPVGELAELQAKLAAVCQDLQTLNSNKSACVRDLQTVMARLTEWASGHGEDLQGLIEAEVELERSQAEMAGYYGR